MDGKGRASPEESRALWWLSHGYEKDEATGRQILEMPFMKTINDRDAVALESLGWLEPATIQHVLAHPSLRDGVTDEWTDVVTILRLVLPAYEEFEATEREIADKRELIDTILTPDQTTVVRRSIDLPLAGEVPATVIWPDATDKAPVRFMDILEHALRTQEEFMGVPYPESFVVMIVADIIEYAGFYAGDGIIVIADGEY